MIVFYNLVDLTEPICQIIDSEKADMTIFDSSGIEPFFTENNPKYANRIIKQLKAYAKAKDFNESYDPYKADYVSMPQQTLKSNSFFINGHFYYAYKFGIVTNGLGIIRHLAFYDRAFFDSHPDIEIGKNSDSPDEDKSVHDARLLIPTLIDFFKIYPVINPKTFLRDAAFDSIALYKDLLTGDTLGKDRHFSKVYIPLNSRSGLENTDYTLNEDGIPCCPHAETLATSYKGTFKLKSSVTRYKFMCPKIKWETNSCTGKHAKVCHCDNPCTTSSCGT